VLHFIGVLDMSWGREVKTKADMADT